MPGSVFRLLNSMQLNPFTLRFKGEKEQAYKEHYNRVSLPFVRLGLFLGIIIYSAFGIFDYLTIENYKASFFIVRYVIAVPFGVLILGLTFVPVFFRYTQMLAVYVIVVGGVGVIAIILMATPEEAKSMFSGLMILIMANYSLLQMRFKFTLFSGWFIFFMYIVAAKYILDISGIIMSNQATYLIGTNVLGMFTAYYLDFSQRRDYYYVQLLEKQKTMVDDANLQLESRISNRTKQLLASNKTLKLEIESRRNEEEKRIKLEQQLFFLQKMETIGTFSGGIAHDFNNILATINGYADIILRSPGTQENTINYIEQIQQATTRANDLIKQLLTFSKDIKPKFQKATIDSIVQEAVNFLKPVINKNILLKVNITKNTHEIFADHSQIHQVIMNLVSNAQHALMNKGGELSISLNNKNVGQEQKKYVCLTISDTGSGMDEETQKRIFEPYYTTKETNEGHGLGLSMVHGIVQNHNGIIQIDSKPEKGTTFHILFPALQ